MRRKSSYNGTQGEHCRDREGNDSSHANVAQFIRANRVRVVDSPFLSRSTCSTRLSISTCDNYYKAYSVEVSGEVKKKARSRCAGRLNFTPKSKMLSGLLKDLNCLI